MRASDHNYSYFTFLQDSNLTPYDVASMHGQTAICKEMELRGYQAPTSLSREVGHISQPHTPCIYIVQHTKQEVEHMQRQGFLDMENIEAFRTIVRGESSRHSTTSKHDPQTHSSPGIPDFNTYNTPPSP